MRYCHLCAEEIASDEGYYAVNNHPSGSPKDYHETCYDPEPADDVDYWPPASEFPTDEELQREELKEDRL